MEDLTREVKVTKKEAAKMRSAEKNKHRKRIQSRNLADQEEALAQQALSERVKVMVNRAEQNGKAHNSSGNASSTARGSIHSSVSSYIASNSSNNNNSSSNKRKDPSRVSSDELDTSILQAHIEQMTALVPKQHLYKPMPKPPSFPWCPWTRLPYNDNFKENIQWLSLQEQEAMKTNNSNSNSNNKASTRRSAISDTDMDATLRFLAEEVTLTPQIIAMARLDYEINAFAEYVQLTPIEQQCRDALIEDVSTCVHSRWPAAEVAVFGSYASDLGIFNSDIDMSIQGMGITVDEDGRPLTAETTLNGALKGTISMSAMQTSMRVVGRDKEPNVYEKIKAAIEAQQEQEQEQYLEEKGGGEGEGEEGGEEEKGRGEGEGERGAAVNELFSFPSDSHGNPLEVIDLVDGSDDSDEGSVVASRTLITSSSSSRRKRKAGHGNANADDNSDNDDNDGKDKGGKDGKGEKGAKGGTDDSEVMDLITDSDDDDDGSNGGSNDDIGAKVRSSCDEGSDETETLIHSTEGGTDEGGDDMNSRKNDKERVVERGDEKKSAIATGSTNSSSNSNSNGTSNGNGNTSNGNDKERESDHGNDSDEVLPDTLISFRLDKKGTQLGPGLKRRGRAAFGDDDDDDEDDEDISMSRLHRNKEGTDLVRDGAYREGDDHGSDDEYDQYAYYSKQHGSAIPGSAAHNAFIVDDNSDIGVVEAVPCLLNNGRTVYIQPGQPTNVRSLQAKSRGGPAAGDSKGAKERLVTLLRQLYKYLQSFDWMGANEIRPRARVPIIAFMHRSGVGVDISLGVDSTEHQAVVQSMYKAGGDVFKPLVMFLKVFLSSLELDKPFNGGIGSFKLYVMVAFIIKDSNQKNKSNTVNLGYYLRKFYKYYGKARNLNTYTTLQVSGGIATFTACHQIDAVQRVFAKADEILDSHFHNDGYGHGNSSNSNGYSNHKKRVGGGGGGGNEYKYSGSVLAKLINGKWLHQERRKALQEADLAAPPQPTPARGSVGHKTKKQKKDDSVLLDHGQGALSSVGYSDHKDMIARESLDILSRLHRNTSRQPLNIHRVVTLEQVAVYSPPLYAKLRSFISVDKFRALLLSRHRLQDVGPNVGRNLLQQGKERNNGRNGVSSTSSKGGSKDAGDRAIEKVKRTLHKHHRSGGKFSHSFHSFGSSQSSQSSQSSKKSLWKKEKAKKESKNGEGGGSPNKKRRGHY